jgi:hypothetical protein
MNAEIDVRHVLPSIHVPTLVLYRRDEYLREHTRYMGERIPGARVVALAGADHLPWEGTQDDVLGEIERSSRSCSGSPSRRACSRPCSWSRPTAPRSLRRVRADVARFRGTELALTTTR